MNENLTLLQRGVLSRLRDAGHDVLADEALERWPDGKRINVGANLHVVDLETALFDDFMRANAQATGSASAAG